MGLRDKLRWLRKASEPLVVSIPQPNGPPARFPESQLRDAFVTATRRQCGENIEPHPLGLAAARSPDPTWSESFYADDGSETSPVEDLSE